MPLGLFSVWPAKEAIAFFERSSIDAPLVAFTLVSSVHITMGDISPPKDIEVDFWAVKTGMSFIDIPLKNGISQERKPRALYVRWKQIRNNFSLSTKLAAMLDDSNK